MTIAELFEYVDEILENPFSDKIKLRWLNQVEAELQVDVLLLAADGIARYTLNDLDAELLAPAPYDQLYHEYLFLQICMAQHEDDLANKYAVTYNRAYNEYVRFICETIDPGSGKAELLRYYLTAYQIAVKHGYTGSEAEWILSLKGERGEPGAGLKIRDLLETEDELPQTDEIGDAYLVGTAEDNRLYLYNGANWRDCGPLRGNPGPAGRGIRNITGNNDGTWTVTYTDGNQETVTNDGLRQIVADAAASANAAAASESAARLSRTNAEYAAQLAIENRNAAAAASDRASSSETNAANAAEEAKQSEEEVKNATKDLVKSVNGQTPDENGNVTVNTGNAEVTAESIQAALGYTPAKPGDIPANVVQYAAQSLTAAQQGQARANIAAAAAADLANYYKKSETYSQSEIEAKLTAIPKFSIKPVASLPTSGISATTVYLVATTDTTNLYLEYIFVPTNESAAGPFTDSQGRWEPLGAQTVDLEGYVQREEIPTVIEDALAEAKASGAFDGKDGQPGQDGKDGRGIVSIEPGLQAGNLQYYDINYTDNTQSQFSVANGLDGNDGKDGQRGTGILKVTTAPSGYTTAIGDYTPKYRIALSTVKTQSKATEVLIGDVIQYSYYQYQIDYLDSSYAYISATRTSIRGAAGADGSDATVTAENIEAALGYVPANPADIPEGGGVTPDWNAAEGEPGHVLNRTHYVETVTTDIVPKKTVTLAYDSMYNAYASVEAGAWSLVVGNTYKVSFAGTEYECVAFEGEFMGYPAVAVGNYAFMGGTTDTGEPFLAAVLPVMSASGLFSLTGGEFEFGIIGEAEIVHPLDDKFIQTEYKLSLAVDSCDKTWAEIVAALDAGKTLVSEARTINTARETSITRLQMSYCKYNATNGLIALQGLSSERFLNANGNTLDTVGVVIYATDGNIVAVHPFETQFDPDDIPEELPNPEAIVFAAGKNPYLYEEGKEILPNPSYDGYSGMTIYIPTKTSHLENDSGFVTSVPSALKNPYALTINGTSYDGSKAVEMTIEGGGGDNVPDYVRTEAERVAAVVQSRQNANTFTFIAMSDAHFSTASSATVEELTASVTHMGQAMKIIREQVHIDLTVSLGDMVWDALDTPALGMSAMRYVSQCLFGGHTGAVHLRARGNHDSLYSSNNSQGTGQLNDDQIFANIGAWNRGSVFDPDNKPGGYCYRDFEDAKLRVIILNSSETNTGGCLYSAQQVTWLNDALDLTEKGGGWRSIVMGHHPLDWSRDGGGNPFTAVNGASGLICSFHGHTHNYLSGTVNGTTLKRIAIPNACSRGRENEYGSGWGEATTYPKVHGTAEDTAFCVVTIDLAAHKIYADHYGAGYDREIEYVDSGTNEPEKLRNEVDYAQDASSEALYNGVGYKTGFYLSSSGGDTAQSSGESLIATGYIPYEGLWAKDNVLYIKGADVTSISHVRIYGYASKGSAPLGSASCNGTNLESTYFTKEVLGEHYYKLTHKNGASTAQWLRLSLELPAGYTGEELIVSIGKPIE